MTFTMLGNNDAYTFKLSKLKNTGKLNSVKTLLNCTLKMVKKIYFMFFLPQ